MVKRREIKVQELGVVPRHTGFRLYHSPELSRARDELAHSPEENGVGTLVHVGFLGLALDPLFLHGGTN